MSGFCLSVRSGEIVFQSFFCDAATARVRPCALVAEFITADGTEVLHAGITGIGAIVRVALRTEAGNSYLAIVTERIIESEHLVALWTGAHFAPSPTAYFMP